MFRLTVIPAGKSVAVQAVASAPVLVNVRVLIRMLVM